MKTHLSALGFAFLIGIVGFVLCFIIGSVTGNGKLGIASISFWYGIGGFFLGRGNPKSFWYSGVAICLPIWIFFIGLADPGQFSLYMNGLLVALVCSYLGAILGLILLQRNKS